VVFSLAIDLDCSTLHPSLYFGVRRSPINTPGRGFGPGPGDRHPAQHPAADRFDGYEAKSPDCRTRSLVKP